MRTAQTQVTAYPDSPRAQVNTYRNARISGEVTLCLTPISSFATCEAKGQTASPAEISLRENLLVEILVRAAVISDADAVAALAGSHNSSAIEYVRIFCRKSAGACDAFVILLEKAWTGRLTLNQAAVAANHVYMAGASVAEAVQLVKWAGR